MPLDFSPYQKKVILQRRGLDPEEYDINLNSGEILPIFKETPPIGQVETTPYIPVVAKPATPTSSSFVAGLRAFGKSVIPSGIGVGAAAGTAALLAPETLGTSLLALPVIFGAGALGSALAEKGQEAILPESVNQRLRQDIQEHPVAAKVGQLAGVAPTLGFSPSNLLRAGRTVGQLGRAAIVGSEQAPIAGAELANLANVGIGGAVAAGQETIPNLISGQPINPLDVALSTIAGAGFNKPTKLIGQRLGLQDIPQAPNLRKGAISKQAEGGESYGGEFNRKLGEAVRAKYIEEEPTSLRGRIARAETEGGKEQEIFDISETQQRPSAFFSEKDRTGEKYIIGNKKLTGYAKQYAPELVNEQGKLRGGIDEDSLRVLLDERAHGQRFEDYRNAIQEAAALTAQEKALKDFRVSQNLVEASVENRPPVTTTGERADIKEQNYQYYKKLQKSGKFDEAKKFAEKFPSFVERYAYEVYHPSEPEVPFGPVSKIKPKKKSFLEKEMTEEERLKFRKYQEEGQGIRLQSATELEKQAAEAKRNLSPTAKLFKYFQDVIGPVRGVRIESDATIKDESTGKSIKGVAFVKDAIKGRLAKLNPNLATLDTLPHEPLHIFMQDLEDSPHTGDRRIINKFYDAVKNDTEFKAINESRTARGEHPFSANEIATEGTGLEIARQILDFDNLYKSPSLKRAWKDLLSQIKIKWGRASKADYERIIANRFFTDPTYAERFTTKGKLPTTITKGKEEENANRESREIQEREENPPAKEAEEQGDTLQETGPNNRANKLEQTPEQAKVTKASLGEQGLTPENYEEFLKRKEPKSIVKPSLKEYQKGLNVQAGTAARLGKASSEASRAAIEDLEKLNTAYLPEATHVELRNQLLAKGMKENEVNKLVDFYLTSKKVREEVRNIIGDEAFDEVNDRLFKNLKRIEEISTEDRRTFQEKFAKANKKAEELEAFERTDVHRHEEEQQGLQQGSFVQGANTLRAMEIFGAGMYDKKPASTIAKEAIQNATDAFPKGQTDRKIYTGITNDQQLFIADNGKGMAPSEVINTFLPAFVSGKEGSESRGSFGLAKIALLGSPEEWIVKTTAKVGDRKLNTEITGSPEEWKIFVSEGLRLDFNPNEPGEYHIHGMPFTVKEVPNDYQTGTLYMAKVPSHYEGKEHAEKMLADIFEDFDVSSRYRSQNAKDFTLNEALNLKDKKFLEAHQLKTNLKSLETHSVPGSKIEVKSASNQGVRTYRIPIFNRGLLQFELPFYQDARLPEGLSIEVTPTVGVEDSNYPYTTNRDNLKGETKKKVDEIIKGLAEFTKNQQIGMFKKVQNKSQRITGTNTRYLDLSDSVPQEVKDEIVNSPILASLGKLLRPMIRQMLDYADKRIGKGKFLTADFSGFASGGDFYGVRFGTREEGSAGQIYFDPFLLSEKVNHAINDGMYIQEEFPLAYAEAVSGTAVHEIAHQLSHSEGEEHARVMTDLVGVLQGIGFSHEKKIVNALKKLGGEESRRNLSELNEKIKQYENKTIASSLVESGRGEQFQKRPSTTTFESGEKGKLAEGRYEGIGGESKFSTKEQGLTPEEIKENFKRTGEAEEFQPQNVFKRGLKELLSSRLPIFGSDISKLETRGGKSGKLIAPALEEVYAGTRANEGKYLNPSLDAVRPLSNDQLDTLYHTMLAEVRSGKSFEDSLSNDLKVPYKTLREIFLQKQEDQIAANQPIQAYQKTPQGFKVVYRLPKIDPNYFPQIVGGKQLDILLNQTDSPAFNSLKKDFINFQKDAYKITADEAAGMFDDLIASYGGPIKGDLTHFGAVRRSEGIGLPDSWIEQDMPTALRRYWRRVSKDRAFYDAIESNHDLLHIIGRTRDAWGKPVKASKGISTLNQDETLTNILENIQGRNIKTNPRLDAFGRIAQNLVLGPITGITDLINAVPLLAKFIPSAGHIPGLLGSIMNIKQGITNAKKTGFIRENVTAIGDIVSPESNFVEKLRSTANLISKVNTREYLEKFSRGLSQAAAEYLIKVHKGLAAEGNAKSENFLKNLSKKENYNNLSNEELATRLAEFTQGTYDPRGLPSWALDSQIAPIFRLARWNIEQLNSLHKHVLLPLKDGNFTPLFTTIAGGLLGGYLAKEVREQINARKQPIPEWAEILSSSKGLSGNIPAAAYNLAAAISYSGVTGILGDVNKAAFDVAFKNIPQGFNYPLVELVGDAAVKITQAVSAMVDEGESPIDVLPKLMNDLAIQHTQAFRVGENIANKAGLFGEKKQKEAETKNQRRNLRIFKMVEDLPYSAQGLTGDTENPYVGIRAKAFKNAGIEELPQAREQANELIKKAFEKGRNNPEIIRRELSKLRRMQVTTMPSSTSNPLDFSRFKKFNERLRGPEATRELIKDYNKQKLANQVKARYIP